MGWTWLSLSKQEAELSTQGLCDWLLDSEYADRVDWLRWLLSQPPRLQAKPSIEHNIYDLRSRLVDTTFVTLRFRRVARRKGLPERTVPPLERSPDPVPQPVDPSRAEVPGGSLTLPEIGRSLARFHQDHPADSTTAFIMMRFGRTEAHEKIARGVKDALQPHGILGLRADDRQYHTDVFFNILTYMHGCSFGIAVFEQLETLEFNPNVSLEVGYMYGLGKQVCLLKDRALKVVQADLMGKLYIDFESSDPGATIPPGLTRWLRDWDFA